MICLYYRHNPVDTEWSHTNGNTQDVDNEEEPTISGTREFCLLIFLYDQNIFDCCVIVLVWRRCCCFLSPSYTITLVLLN